MKKSFFTVLVILLLVFLGLSFAIAQKDSSVKETSSDAYSDVNETLQQSADEGKEAGQMDMDTDFVNQTGGIGEEIGEQLRDEAAVSTDE